MTELSPELEAMAAIEKAVSALEDEDMRLRVIRWAAERFGLRTRSAGYVTARGTILPRADEDDVSADALESIGRLFEAANPTSNPERALVAAYWFQERQGEQELNAQTINNELKQMGYPAPNITSTFNLLMSRTPALMRQVRKSGRTKQARKKYTLTEAGKRVVRSMLAGAGPALAEDAT